MTYTAKTQAEAHTIAKTVIAPHLPLFSGTGAPIAKPHAQIVYLPGEAVVTVKPAGSDADFSTFVFADITIAPHA